MNKPSVILIGAGGHANACIDVIEQAGQFRIAGLVGLTEELNTLHLGYSVIGTDDELPQLAKSYEFAFISVGQIRSPESRVRLFRLAVKLGFQIPSVISPAAIVSSHATVGSGAIVMHGAIVNAGARIGNNCIINSQALVEHDASVEDHCHIATGAIVNGGACIGSGSFVGSGCIVKECTTIGAYCVVGMGISVRRNLPDRTRLVSGDLS